LMLQEDFRIIALDPFEEKCGRLVDPFTTIVIE